MLVLVCHVRLYWNVGDGGGLLEGDGGGRGLWTGGGCCALGCG